MRQKKSQEQSVLSGNIQINKNSYTVKINKPVVVNWLRQVANHHGKKIEDLEYNFMSDEELLVYNIEYLGHDNYTDIITFDISENECINGSILISMDRIKENAKAYKCSQTKELMRVMAHGLLHLIGFKDKSINQQKEMRAEEDNALYLYEKLKSST